MNQSLIRPILRVEAVEKHFDGPHPIPAVQGVSFELQAGAFAALVGPSGSGKTTLLNLVSGLDTPTRGRVFIHDVCVSSLTEKKLCDFRRWNLGFIFQAYNLIPTLSAIENIEYTSVIRGDPDEEARKKALAALDQVGLKAKAQSYPHQLSGGQQQRVAVARALASTPQIIFADEPTANLDSKTALELIGLFEELNRTQKVTFLFSTHDLKLVDRVSIRFDMKDGRIVS